LVATVAIPLRYARAKSPRAGLRSTIVGMTIYIFLWTVFCVYGFLKMGGGY
jgi:hypothetical protein